MNEREKQKFWSEVNKIEWIITGIIFMIIILFIIYASGTNRWNVASRYRQIAKDHLEEKYGEEFEVDRWHDTRNSYFLPSYPLSGKFPKTSQYWGLPDTIYQDICVRITRSKYGYKIKKIDDNYCWQPIRKQLQNYTIDSLSQELGEIKVNVAIVFHTSFFSDKIHLDTDLQDVFDSKDENRMGLDITIVIPDKDKFSESELDTIIHDFIRQIKQESNNFLEDSIVNIQWSENPDIYANIQTEDDANPTHNNRRIKDILFSGSLYSWAKDNELITLKEKDFSDVD